MHEVSIVTSLLQIAERTARENNATTIKAMWLRIGQMSCVNEDSLRFCFDIMSKDTLAEGCEVHIENTPIRIRCQSCSIESDVEQFVFRCSQCDSSDVELMSGRELDLVSLAVE